MKTIWHLIIYIHKWSILRSKLKLGNTFKGRLCYLYGHFTGLTLVLDPSSYREFIYRKIQLRTLLLCKACYVMLHLSREEVCIMYYVYEHCYVMQTVLCFNFLGDKCLSHAKLMSTALTQLLIFRFSCLLTNKGKVQQIDNSN